jgi:hypothetical protein
MKKLNREQAIEIAGIDAVEAVEAMNCEYTNRVTNGTEWHGYDEFSATYDIDDYATLTAYYFVASDDLKDVEDLSDINWKIEYYIYED